MDEEIKKTEEETQIELLNNVPDEVWRFMATQFYSEILEVITSVLSLSVPQKELMTRSSAQLLTREKTLDDVGENLEKNGFSRELAVKTCFALQTEIVERAAGLVEFFDPPESETETGTDPEAPQNKFATNQTDMLDSIKARLVQPKSIAPAFSDKSFSVGDVGIKPNTPSTPVTMDPYREKPDAV